MDSDCFVSSSLFFSDSPWSSKVLLVFLWQGGEHCCPTDPLAHGFDRLCAEELEGAAFLPSSSPSLSWWEIATCSYFGESRRCLSKLHNTYCKAHPGIASVVAGDLPAHWCQIGMCKSVFSNVQLSIMAEQSVGKLCLYVNYVKEWLFGGVALTPKCIIWGSG